MAFGFDRTSRVNLVAWLSFAFILIIAFRLFQLQVIDHQKYADMAEGEHLKQLTIPAKRGKIYALDRGVPSELVMNTTVYTVFVDPQIATNHTRIVQVIKDIAGGNVTTDIQTALDKKNSRYQVVATDLSRTQAELIKKENLSGVGFHENTKRAYLEDGLASQILGFVNHDGLGQYGIEGSLDKRLKGTDGLLQTVTDINLVPLTIGDKNISTPAQDGEDLVLTIDKTTQMYTEQALARGVDRIGADRGSVIVMDPNTSHIMAIANYPTYNVTEYQKVGDISVYSNPALTDIYDPGSVIKPFTIATGLEEGVITPSTTYYNRDFIKIDDATVYNATRGYTGNITMQTALNHSLNTGTINILQRLGDGEYITREARDTIYDYFHGKFGFGRKTGIELDESIGQIISPEEVEGNAVRYSNMSFGQGMSLNMLQVATAFCSLINGGEYRAPTILAGQMKNNKFVPSNLQPSRTATSPNTSDIIKQMLVDARASAFSHKDKPGYITGGKTGTSETIENGSYVKSTTIGSYIGFGGDSSPKYVIMVRVQGAGMNIIGSADVEPIFADISNWMINNLNLKPRG